MRIERSIVVALSLASAALPAQESSTVIVGRIRSAVAASPVAGATVRVGPWLDSALTDSAGRFTIRVPRATDAVWFYRRGFLDFRFPFLALTADTLVAEVELRPDPLPPAMFDRNGRIRMVCARFLESRRLEVDSCDWRIDPPAGTQRRMYKPNPFVPYFGTAIEDTRLIVDIFNGTAR